MKHPLTHGAKRAFNILSVGVCLAIIAPSTYAYGSDQDYTSVNKRISVTSGSVAEEISSVNGSVSVGDSVTADEISSVNGKITVGTSVTADEVSTVNGKIEIGSNAQIKQSVEAVNGKIEIDTGSEIGENVSTVNGSIELTGVSVGRNVKSVNGNIYLQDGTTVKGDVIIGGQHSNNQWNKSWNNKPPKLVVDATSTIDGKIIIYREVDFDFADASLASKVDDRSDD